MSILYVILEFRSAVKTSISRIEDAVGYENDDRTIPNWETKQNLQALLDDFLCKVKPYGFRVITSHLSCSNSEHNREIFNELSERDIDIDLEHFEDIKDRSYCVDVGKTYAICKCDESDYSQYDIFLDIYGEKGELLNIHRKLSVVYHEVREAILNCRDRGPRSAIRERLYKAVIAIDEIILPFDIEEYALRLALMSRIQVTHGE